MREALYYQVEGSLVKCELCPNYCTLSDGDVGRCRGKKAIDGKLFAINYGLYASLAVDPIEKKPLHRYKPRTNVLSIGPNSCNMNCNFCQNWVISQQACPTKNITTNQLAELVRQYSPWQVAFTYTEPLMWYEFILDFVKDFPEINIILVTNGYLCTKPFLDILPHVSAMNIDLKGINKSFYETLCAASIDPVLENIQLAYEAGIHLEITNLLIPGFNDSDDDVNRLCSFIRSISPEIPLHISAYHPSYKLRVQATDIERIKHACKIASTYLKYVYAGNVHIPEFSAEASYD